MGPRLHSILLLIALQTASALAPSISRRAAADEAPLSLSEIRDAERRIEERRNSQLRALESGVSAQTVDADSASERRFRIEREYQRDREALARSREAAIQALESASRPRDPKRPLERPARSQGAASLPKIPSQSVITWPSSDSAPTAEPESPHRQGRSRNVGVGVGELEF